MQFSEQMNDIAAALAAAQAEMHNAVKDAKNPHFNTKYADLAAVSEACRGPLNRQGIAVVQSPIPADAGKIGLETRLLHKSGQWVRCEMYMPMQQNTPQGYGSAMTYARRYSLAALAGVCPEDDDGEGAMGRDQGKGRPPQQPNRGPQNRPPATRPAPTQQQPAPRTDPPAPAREVIDEETGVVTTDEHDAAEPQPQTEAQGMEIKRLMDALPKTITGPFAKAAMTADGAKRLGELSAPAAAKLIQNLKTVKPGDQTPAPAPKSEAA